MRIFLKTLFLLTVLNIVSCSGDDDGENGNSENTLTALVDGQSFTANDISGTFSVMDGEGGIVINAIKTDTNERIQFFIGDGAALGTYDVNINGNGKATAFYGAPNSVNGQSGFADSGALTITAHNTATKIISGTFNFQTFPVNTPDDFSVITDGAFTINYTDL